MKTYKYLHVVYWNATGSSENLFSDNINWKEAYIEAYPREMVEDMSLTITYSLTELFRNNYSQLDNDNGF